MLRARTGQHMRLRTGSGALQTLLSATMHASHLCFVARCLRTRCLRTRRPFQGCCTIACAPLLPGGRACIMHDACPSAAAAAAAQRTFAGQLCGSCLRLRCAPILHTQAWSWRERGSRWSGVRLHRKHWSVMTARRGSCQSCERSDRACAGMRIANFGKSSRVCASGVGELVG